METGERTRESGQFIFHLLLLILSFIGLIYYYTYYTVVVIVFYSHYIRTIYNGHLHALQRERERARDLITDHKKGIESVLSR